MKFAFVMMTLVLASCAAKTRHEHSRMPASASAESGEQAFEKLRKSENPEAELHRHIDRLAALFYRSQKLLMEFDAALEARAGKPQPVPIIQTKVAQKLDLIRAMQEDQRDKIVFLYASLLENADSEDWARRLISALWTRVGESWQHTERFALQDLVLELKSAHEELQAPDFLAQVSSGEVAPGFEQPQFHSEKDLLKFLDGKDPVTGVSRKNTLVKAAVTEAASSDLEFDAALEALPPITSEEGRSPQSVQKIAPGAGPSGNMNGNEFPSGTWALTFDDGPTEWSRKIMGILKANNAKATFFWLAKLLKNARSTEIVSLAKTAGHTLANHSYNHHGLSSRSTDLDLEINQSTKLQTEIYGQKPRFFRCPYGRCIVPPLPRVRQMIAAQGMVHAFWNVDSEDYHDVDPRSLYRRVLLQMKERGRGIILFHDHKPNSSFVLPRLFSDYFKPNAAKTKVLTLTEAVDKVNGVVSAPISVPGN